MVASYYISDALAFWRPGDLNWTKIHIQITNVAFTAMNCYKGQFYYLTRCGKVWVFEISGPHLVIELERHIWRYKLAQFYLVELSGALLLVTRFDRHMDSEVDIRPLSLKSLN